MDIRHLGNIEHFLFKKKYYDFEGYTILRFIFFLIYVLP